MHICSLAILFFNHYLVIPFTFANQTIMSENLKTPREIQHVAIEGVNTVDGVLTRRMHKLKLRLSIQWRVWTRLME